MSQWTKQWNREWEEFSSGPDGALALARWSSTPVLRAESMSELLGRLDARAGRGPEEADRILVALVARAREGDRDAARAVVQAMFPAVIAVGRRARLDPAEVVGDLWQMVVEYPLERRPGHVAANLRMDLWKRARAIVVATDSAREQVEEPVAPDPYAGMAEALEILTAAVGAGVIGTDQAQMVWRCRVEGVAGVDVAAERGRTPAWVWQQLRRSERRMAEHLPALGYATQLAAV